jgi:uncharacterized protein YjbJ (UPF0337 family)
MSGAAKNLAGNMEEDFGRASGDAKSGSRGRRAGPGENEGGRREHAEGSIQKLCGQAVSSAEDAADTVRQMPASLDHTIRRYVESNPYTTAAIALGLGWLVGRSHRPF